MTPFWCCTDALSTSATVHARLRPPVDRHLVCFKCSLRCPAIILHFVPPLALVTSCRSLEIHWEHGVLRCKEIEGRKVIWKRLMLLIISSGFNSLLFYKFDISIYILCTEFPSSLMVQRVALAICHWQIPLVSICI